MGMPDHVHRTRLIPLLTLGALVVSSVVILLAAGSRLPSDSALWMDFTSPTVRIEAVFRPESTLRGGDRLVAINGEPVQTWLDGALRGEGADWQVGDTLTYRFVDEKQPEVRRVPLRPLALDRIFVLRWGVYLTAFASLALGLYVLLNFPNEPAARALFVGVVGLFIPLCLHMHVGLLTAPRLLVAQNLAKMLGRSLLVSAFLHIALVFPVPKRLLAHRRYLFSVLYFIPPLIVLLTAQLFAQAPSQHLILAWRTTLWLSVVLVICGGSLLVHSYLTVTDSLARAQLQWVLWGVLFGALPYLLLTGLPEALKGYAWVNVGITAIFVLLTPLTITLALTRQWLFDVDVLVRHTVLVVMFALLMTGVYRLLTIILTLSRPATGRINEAMVIFITAFLVGAAAWAYQHRLSRVMGQLFSRGRVDPQRLLNDMGERLARALYLEDVQALLTDSIPSYLGASSGRLMLLHPTREQLLTVKAEGFSLPSGSRAFPARWMQAGGKPLRRALLPAWVPDEIRAFMVAQDVELLFLLLSGEQVIGIWGLGPMYGRRIYTLTEVRMFQALACQAALALEKARLVARLEERGEFLETEMRRRMRLLEQERNRLNTILQTMVDGLLVTSPEGNIMMVNPTLEDLLHRSAQHLIAQPLTKYLNVELLQRAISRALEQPGRADIVEFALQERNLQAVSTALWDGSAVITMLRDVTRETEVDRMKSEIISGISHELRTPLTSILGFTKMLQRIFRSEILPVLPDDAGVQATQARIEQNLAIMLAEEQRLTDLIDDVLDVAALDSGEMEWHDQLYNFPALLRRVVDQMRPVAQAKGLQLRLRVERGVLHLEADPDRVEQVLSNLLSNAIKFTSQGTVTVSARALQAGQQIHGWRVPVGGAVHVTVRDTGRGISPAAQADLFQRFRQFGDGEGQKPRGSGLGLVICREIVMHYGGTIWVESKVGRGSTFAFTLPVHLQAADIADEDADMTVASSRG